MNEQVSIRRYDGYIRVNVTRKDEHSVHWSVRVIGPNAQSVRAAVMECRRNLDMLEQGIALTEIERIAS